MIPETRYAQTPDGVYIAYQVAGEGPVDVAWQFPFLGNVDLLWEAPVFGTLLRGIASFARLILHDRRGTGLSSRNVPPPDLETRVADLRVVLDAVGSERPVLGGLSEGGAANALLAASSPERVQSIVWWGPVARNVWSPDYPWGVGPEYVEANERELQHWGTLEGARIWAEADSMYGNVITEEEIRAYAKLSRHTATPDVARELNRIWYETDIRSVLPSVNVPALLLDQHEIQRDVEETQYVASLMPQAELRVVPQGVLTSPEVLTAVLDEIRRFVGSSPRCQNSIRSSPRSCSPTSWPRPRNSPRWVGTPGRNSSSDTTPSSGRPFTGGAASKSTLRVTASTPRSTAPLVQSGVRSTSLSGSRSWA